MGEIYVVAAADASVGARGICVVSAILNAADVAGECRRYRAKMEDGKSGKRKAGKRKAET